MFTKKEAVRGKGGRRCLSIKGRSSSDNARKAVKKFLVTLAWVAQARADKGRRSYIERFFALLKRCFRLNLLQTQGLALAYRHAFEVCLAVLLLAWLADHLGRPDLIHARSRLLAPC